MRKYILTIISLVLVCVINAQVKKPTIMVVPADVWCTQNNYIQEYESQGISNIIPDYKLALQKDVNLNNVITKIGELMAERDFLLKDLSTTIKNIEQSTAENMMLESSTSGAMILETSYEKLLNRAKADIIIDISWSINSIGPKQSVTYTMKGVDAYTNKIIAASTGTGEPSFSAEVPVLLEEAIQNNIDLFTSQLQNHFDDLMINGREVSISLLIFDNNSGINMETEYDGEMLTDIVDSWLYNNTQEHRYSISDATENKLTIEQIRMPLYGKNGRPIDTRNFANELRKYLRNSPYNIESKLVTKGLGKAILILGEK